MTNTLKFKSAAPKQSAPQTTWHKLNRQDLPADVQKAFDAVTTAQKALDTAKAALADMLTEQLDIPEGQEAKIAQSKYNPYELSVGIFTPLVRKQSQSLSDWAKARIADNLSA